MSQETRDRDLEVIAPIVFSYYEYLSGNISDSLDDILNVPLTADQKRLLASRMDDVDFLWELTSPLRRLSENRELREKFIEALDAARRPSHAPTILN